MFLYSIVDLVEQASTQYQGNVAELMIGKLNLN